MVSKTQTQQIEPAPIRWRGFLTCLVTMLFFATGGGGYLLLIVGYLEKRGLPVTEIGSVMSLLSIVEGSTCLLVGHFYKGKWTREILILGLLLNGSSALILAFQPMGVLVWFSAALTGAGFGVFTVIMYVAALQRKPSKLALGLAVGLYTGCIAGGNGMGALLGGWLTDQYGFWASFGFCVACYAVALLVLLTLNKKPVPVAEAGETAKADAQPVEGLLQSPGWIIALLTAFTLSSVNMVFDILFPVYTLRTGMSFTLVGSLSGIKMVMAALIRPFSGVIMTRLQPQRLNNWSLVGLAAGTVMIPLVGMGFGLTAVIALLGLTFGSVRTTSATLVVKDENRPQVISRRISYYNTSLTLGQIVSPWMIGIIADRIEITTALMIVPATFISLYGIGWLALPHLMMRLQSLKERTSLL